MKITIAYLCVFLLLISCKGKITNIKITPTNNNKNYKCYILKYGENPRSSVSYECPWIKDPENTVFIYMPISFKLENNTGRNLRISKLWDNFSSDTYQPMNIRNKFYNEANAKIIVNSGNSEDIILFVHLPVHKNLLDKEYYERLFPTFQNHKQDSIVLNKINPELQKAIDLLLKKKSISAHLYEDNDFYGGALTMYCVNRQKSETFKMDSLSKLKTSFRYNCD
ncbi:hypothetical protein [Flavobacterium reichenbachii]|nr:hypothetical protein [Flavobacterium reichenbachii]